MATLTFDSDIPTCGHSPQPVRPSCLYTICDFPFLAMLPISRFPLRRDHNCDSVYATGLSDPAAYSLRQEYKRATVRFPDSTVYSNNRYWPAVPVQVVDEGFLGGDNHIVTVAVWPISYAPTDGEILFRNSVTVRLDYSVKNAGSEKPIAPSGDIPQSNRQK